MFRLIDKFRECVDNGDERKRKRNLAAGGGERAPEKEAYANCFEQGARIVCSHISPGRKTSEGNLITISHRYRSPDSRAVP